MPSSLTYLALKTVVRDPTLVNRVKNDYPDLHLTGRFGHLRVVQLIDCHRFRSTILDPEVLHAYAEIVQLFKKPKEWITALEERYQPQSSIDAFLVLGVDRLRYQYADDYINLVNYRLASAAHKTRDYLEMHAYCQFGRCQDNPEFLKRNMREQYYSMRQAAKELQSSYFPVMNEPAQHEMHYHLERVMDYLEFSYIAEKIKVPGQLRLPLPFTHYHPANQIFEQEEAAQKEEAKEIASRQVINSFGVAH